MDPRETTLPRSTITKTPTLSHHHYTWGKLILVVTNWPPRSILWPQKLKKVKFTLNSIKWERWAHYAHHFFSLLSFKNRHFPSPNHLHFQLLKTLLPPWVSISQHLNQPPQPSRTPKPSSKTSPLYPTSFNHTRRF